STSISILIVLNAFPTRRSSDLQCATTTTMTIVVNNTPDSPTATSPQTITPGQTLADIIVTGDNLTWYSDENLTTIVDETLVLTRSEEHTSELQSRENIECRLLL